MHTLRGGRLSLIAAILIVCLGAVPIAVGQFGTSTGDVYAGLVLFFKTWFRAQLQNNANEVVASNYRAADKVNETQRAIFEQQVTMDMQMPPEICLALDIMSGAKLADRNIASVIKDIEKPLLNTLLATETPFKHALDRVRRHDGEYCSEADVQRGRCRQPDALPNGDISADALLTANGYGEAERKAAQAYIDHLVNPEVPVLPEKHLEKTPQGDALRGVLMTAAARKSLAALALGEVIGDRTRVASTGHGTTNGEASPQELLFEEMERRYGDPHWFDALANNTPGALQREQLVMQAWAMRLAAREYRQNERIKVLLATLVAMDAEQRMRDDLKQLREATERAVQPKDN